MSFVDLDMAEAEAKSCPLSWTAKIWRKLERYLRSLIVVPRCRFGISLEAGTATLPSIYLMVTRQSGPLGKAWSNHFSG